MFILIWRKERPQKKQVISNENSTPEKTPPNKAWEIEIVLFAKVL